MKPSEKDQKKGSSYIGMFFSVALHVGVILFLVFWGLGEAEKLTYDGVIQVSLSGYDGGGSNMRPKPAPVKPKEKIVEKEEVPPSPPEKVEPPKEEKKEIKEVEKEPEPEKKEEPKEIVKEEIKKKDVIPLETEKEKKKPKKKVEATPKPNPKPTEAPKKEGKKEVAKKTEKKPEKKTEKKPDATKAREDYIAKLKRDKVLKGLTRDEVAETEEDFGEERKLAMADNTKSGLKKESELETGSGGGSSTSKSGSGSVASPAIIRAYRGRLSSDISRRWSIPPSVPTDGSLKTEIFFKIDEKGNVFDARVIKSSGNAIFDEYCVSAVYKAAPLTPPPSEIAKEAKSDGIEVSFRNDP